MDFQEHTRGVKIIDNYVAIENANPFGDLSKYDFIYTDYLASKYNGNYCYGSRIQNLNNKEAFDINGWKLIEISFPGDWFGNTARCILEDKYGKSITLNSNYKSKAVYAHSYMHLIREILTTAIEFTSTTPSVEYKEILDGLEVKNNTLSLEEFHKLIEHIDTYINKYKKIKNDLTTEEKEKLTGPLKDAVTNNIFKLIGLKVEID